MPGDDSIAGAMAAESGADRAVSEEERAPGLSRPSKVRTFWVTFYVGDLAETVRFYGDGLGFEIASLNTHQGSAALSLNGATLTFTDVQSLARLSLDDVEAPLRALPQGVAITLDAGGGDLDALFARAVAAGAIVVRPPEEASKGVRSAYVRDPDGFLVRLSCGGHAELP